MKKKLYEKEIICFKWGEREDERSLGIKRGC